MRLLLPLLLLAEVCLANVNDDVIKCQTQVLPKADLRTSPDAGVQYCGGLLAFIHKDYAQALGYLNKAAGQGNAGAFALLGYFYEKGHGVPVDTARAFGYYQRSAQANSSDGMLEVARCYREGVGVVKNAAEAARWSNAAEAHGADVADFREKRREKRVEPDQAGFDAGVRLYKTKDFAGAFPIFLRAANAGNSRAQLQVGSQYERGEGVAKNYPESVRWYAKSAAVGDSTAQKNLGQMYELGMGVAENWMLAAQWFAKSAAQGAADGEFALGRCYEFGMGVEQSRAKAMMWFGRAGALGDSKAAYFFKWLATPTNFIGFRNNDEHNFVMDTTRYSGDFLGGDPDGVLFHNSDERNAFLRAFKTRSDFHQSQTQWGVQHNNYESCVSSHGINCHNPGPQPKP